MTYSILIYSFPFHGSEKPLQVAAHLSPEIKCASFRNKLEFSGCHYYHGETRVNKSEETMDTGPHMNWIAVWVITPRSIILGARTLVPNTIPAESGK